MTNLEQERSENSSRIKRCLFGESDPESVHRQYSTMVKEQLKQAETEWNFDFEDETPTIAEKARFKWERVRSKSVPPMYRSVRITRNGKAQPAGATTSSCLKENNRPASVTLCEKSFENFDKKSFDKKNSKRTGQVKLPPKHIRQKKAKKPVHQQRTITDFMVKNRAGRSSEKPIKTEVPIGKTSPDRIFGVLTRSTSRVHTRSTARRHIVI